MKRLIVLTLFIMSLGLYAKEVEIVILETSDLHGRLFAYEYAIDQPVNASGLTKISTLIKQERAKNKNVVLVDNGDTVQDNSAELFNSRKVHPMIEALNDLKYDVWVLGNHEFNFEKSFLEKNIKAFKKDVLSANVMKTDGKNFVKPYVIKNIDGVRVAFIGLTPPHIPLWEASTPEHYEGLTFLQPEDAIKKTLKEIDGKYDILIGTFHLGRVDEKGGYGVNQIAEAFPQFDIIFGGHEHAVYNTKINGVNTIEPGSYGSNLAKATIKYDTTSKAKDIKTELLETKGVEEDKELMKKYKYVDDESKKFANEVIGEVTATFIERPDFITGAKEITTIPTAQLMETSVIQFINEVQMHYAGADVSAAALFNYGANLEKGPFKRKDVAFIYKYDNTLIGVNITGENLLKYMEWSASYYNQLGKDDLTISFNKDVRSYNYDMFSGINYEIDVTKAAGSRIVNPKIDGKAIQKDKVYKLAVNNYRYGTLENLKLVTRDDIYYDAYEKIQDKGRIRELIVEYVTTNKKGKVEPKLDGNWLIINYNLRDGGLLKLEQKVKAGEITIPQSEDGRTLNIKSIKRSEI